MTYATRQITWACLVLLGLLLSVPLTGQVSIANVGLKGGLNLSSFHGKEVGAAERHRGTIFGLSAELDLGGPFSFQPEFSISKKGAAVADLLGAESGGVWSYNYVDLSGLLDLHLGSRNSSPSFSVFGGPVFSIFVSGKATGMGPEGFHSACAGCARVLMSLPIIVPLQHDTKPTDFGGTVGAGVSIGSGATRLALDVRYTKMMNEFDEAPYDQTYSRKHNAFSVQVGVALSPSAWSRPPRRRAMDSPPEQSIVIVDRIRQVAIEAHDGDLSLYDIIRLERPSWIEGGEVQATLFVDGRPWNGPGDLLTDRRASDVEEIRRIGAGADGIYEGQGVVIEILTR